MRGWDLCLELDRAAATSLALQIARALAARIRAGALAPGALLPSTRALALRLGVHRNTVVAAYGELRAEGWITAEQGRSSAVAADLPAVTAALDPGAASRPCPPRYRLPPAPPRPPPLALARPPGTIELLGGLPDPRLVPSVTLGRAIRRALRRPAVLGYGDPQGHPRVRAALAAMLGATRGMAVTPERLVVVRGAQMALALVARALLRPGDAVAVESLGYPPAWQALRLAGLRLVPIAVDRQGVDVEALAREATRRRIRAVYVTPHHQYPTTVTLSAARRLALLELARRASLLVVEDDYDAEFHYEGHPILPLAASDPGANVIYIGTLSKVLAPGLRLGFVAGHTAAAERLTLQRYYLDRQGDLAVEAAVAELIEEGELQRHVWRVRRAYRARRDALVDALRTELQGTLAFDVPAGGMALWARVARGIDVRRWTERALASGVAVLHGGHFALHGPGPRAIRIGFARHDERELREATRRLAQLPRAE